MKKSFLLLVLVLSKSLAGFSQTCTTTTPGGNKNFFTFCDAGPAPITLANYTLNIANNTTLFFNGDVTFTGTLTISLGGGDSNVQINSGFTLTAANITFTGSSGAGKNLIVNGALSVSGTLAFDSGQPIEIDGSGTISAGSITGTNNITCTSTGGCPTITSSSACSPSGSTLCSTIVVLPIELLYFNAVENEGNILISWSTASELNFDYFEVERSANANDFMSIGKVKGHGTSNVRNDYFLKDEKPLIGKNYYRLKSVDFDGFTEYFNVILVDFSTDKMFSVFPNPSDGHSLGLNLNFVPDGNASIIIYDNLNNVKGTYRPAHDVDKITFSSLLNSGIYYAKIIAGDFVKVERFVVR